jgi:hypothetical protein
MRAMTFSGSSLSHLIENSSVIANTLLAAGEH